MTEILPNRITATWDEIETIEPDAESDALIEKIRNKQDGYGDYA